MKKRLAPVGIAWAAAGVSAPQDVDVVIEGVDKAQHGCTIWKKYRSLKVFAEMGRDYSGME